MPASAGPRASRALRRQVGEQLGVVVDGLVEPVLRIVVAQRVERMGIGGEDRLELRVGEGVHVVLDEHLEQALLADLADVVARVALTVEQQPERHARVVQDRGEPLRLALHALVERGEVSDEPEVLHRLLAGVGDREVESLGPAGARRADLP